LPDANFPWLIRILLSIDSGRVKVSKIIEPDSHVSVDFEFSMPYAVFMMISRGNMDLSLMTVLKGTIKVYGSKISAMRKMKMFKIIVNNLVDILRDWQGKVAILLQRAEFKSPHIILGRDVRSVIPNLVKTKKVFIIAGETVTRIGIVDEIKKQFANSDVSIEVFSGSRPDPSAELVEEAVKKANEFKPDLIIGVGGGSSMDLAKAVFVLYERSDVPLEKVDPSWKLGLRKKTKLVLVPTTSGTGSEANWVSVITFHQGDIKAKIGIANREIIPDYAIVDPFFVYNLPQKLVSITGLDALTHAIESIVSPWSNELVYALGLRAIKLLMKYLPDSYRHGDKEAREKVHYAGTLAGLAFGNSQNTLCHGLGHAFGTTFNIPHGLAVAAFLPYVIDYYGEKAEKAFKEITLELGIEDENSIAELRNRFLSLIRTVDGFTKLSEFGISEEDFNAKLDTLVDLSKRDPSTYCGPRIPTDEEIRKLYQHAYYGKPVSF